MIKQFILGLKQSKSVFYITYSEEYDHWMVSKYRNKAYKFDLVSSAIYTYRYMRANKNLFDDNGSNIIIERFIECPLVEVVNGNA